ncbi:hypothetical protein ACULVM_000950 [Acinetobacter baumannii]
MDKPITFNEWLGTQGNIVLLHANCCRIAFEGGQQSMQAKVEELQTQLSLQRQRVKAFEEELTSSRNYGDELQKRVDELEFQLKDWKQKSMPAMLNGMCGRCGKEPLQGIGSDKEDYALLHCFGCGANKYEWIGEQALKGEG